MPTNYPGGLDSLSNLPDRAPNDVILSAEWNTAKNALIAIETKLGINSSAVGTTLDNQMEVHAHTAGADDGAVISHANLSSLTSGDPHTQYLLDTLIDAKGDLLVGSAADTAGRLAVGADNTVLISDSTQTLGVRWGTTAGGVSSLIWQEGDVTVVTNPTTVDFGPGFDLLESPSGEVNVTIDVSEVKGTPVAIGTANAQGAGGSFADNAHVHQARSHDHSSATDGITLAPSGSFFRTGIVSPAQLTADQIDYNPFGGGPTPASEVRLTSNNPYTIRSLAGEAAGRVVMLHNVGAYPLTLSDEDTTGGVTATRRFALAGAIVIQPDQTTAIWYDATSTRWRASGGSSTSASAAPVLLTVANAGFPGGIIVGAIPGNELGGTWDNPTVDTVHSGSAHHTDQHTLTGSSHTGQLAHSALSTAGFGDHGELFSRVTTNQTFNNTTAAAITGLSVSGILANATYHFRACVFVLGPDLNTTQIKIGMTAPTSPTAIVWSTHGRDSSGTGTGNNYKAITERTNTNNSTMGTFTTETMLMIEGILRNGSNAGSLSIQAANQTASGLTTTIGVDSFLRVVRVA